MEGGIDDFDVVVFLDDLGVEGVLLDAREVDLVHILADDLDVLFAAGHLDVGDRLDFQHFLDDGLVVGGGELAAVAPVGLVAVVLLGIVGGGEHDAGVAVAVADGEAELGGGTHAVEEVDLVAVGSQHVGCDFGELAAVVAAVVADGSAELFLVGVDLADVVGETLGGHCHGVFVHAVGADAHDAAKAAGAELEVAVEALVELVGVGSHVEDGLLGGVVIGTVEPSLCVDFCTFVDVKGLDIHSHLFFYV